MMKRVWRVSEFRRCQTITVSSLNTLSTITKPSVPNQFIREHVTQTSHSNGSQTLLPDIISLFSDKWSYNTAETISKEILREKVSKLKDEVVGQRDDVEKVEKALDEKGVSLFGRYPDGSAVVELLTQLKPFPDLAMEVLNWRRKQLDYAAPMTVEEYSKGIAVADHMEATLREIKELSLTPTIHTYKGLIAGYITAWMWEEMEKTYRIMKAGPIKPDIDIHLLMLRGYAHSGKLEKMEEIYEMVEKVEKLLRLIPEDEYRPWLNVLLICLYATEDLLEQMENSINEAFEHKAYVTTVGVMNAFLFAVDKLADFVRRAEHAGWKV
ncbi:UNVERIFIED_CONTAM: Pentatricopeptide repeat-containing protein [Sesamum radiatum]|uniref:Pentatricopeptide repeat-containing protein n=1 Tax=Sesamum radiatum TaxID=300843 RepID=A0AAW2UQF6_SESRA